MADYKQIFKRVMLKILLVQAKVDQIISFSIYAVDREDIGVALQNLLCHGIFFDINIVSIKFNRINL